MGLFDWLLNPAIAAINKAPPSRRPYLYQIVTAAGYLEFALREVFVATFEKTLAAYRTVNTGLRSGSSLSPSMVRGREQELSRESVLALLKCGDRTGGIPTIFNGLSEESYAWCLSVVCISRFRDKLGTLNEIDYSAVPAEARVQLISNWMRRLENKSSECAQLLSNNVFAENWDRCVATILGSTALAASRLDAVTLQDRATLIAKGMLSTGVSVVRMLREVRFESSSCESDVGKLRVAFDKHILQKPAAPAKKIASPAPEKQQLIGFVDHNGTVHVNETKTSGRVQLIGPDDSVTISYALLMAIWLQVDQEGWSGPCLWVKDKAFARVFVGFERIKGVTSKDAKDFVRAFEHAERKNGLRIEETKARFPEVAGLLQICSRGGFRIVV